MTDIRFPAEWERQSAVQMTWPHIGGFWDEILDAADRNFAEIAAQISVYQPVIITCFDESHVAHVKNCIKRAGAELQRVRLYIAPSNDVWVRDHGPITVLRNDKALLMDFIFNAWGSKYNSADDNALTARLAALGVYGNTEREAHRFILEGGSIDTDGQGTLLVTESCLLAVNRNRKLCKPAIETQLKASLGVKRILWLSQGYLAGDDTNGHIDTLARFTDPHTLCYMSCDDEHDEHFDDLRAMEAELKSFVDYQGKAYRLVKLPLPRARQGIFDGRRLPASYANFLIINNAVLFPTYDDPADSLALHQIKLCFPERCIVPIDCRVLVENFGSLHCATMQLPAGVIDEAI